MHSGIGEPQVLAAHGIKVRVPLPGVGQISQDHPAALLIYGRGDKSPLVSNMRLDRLALGVAEALALGRGFMTDLPGGITGFVKTDPAKPLPDIQLLFIAGSLAAAPYLPPFREAFADSFACRVGCCGRKAAAALRLARRIRLLIRASDRGCCRRRMIGRRCARAFACSASLPVARARIVCRAEIGPGADVTTDAQIETYTRQTAVTAHHPAGTCKMGVDKDQMAVVDDTLRVRGVERLRVVDASVFPDLVGGNINAPVIMIAERAADLIQKRVT